MKASYNWLKEYIDFDLSPEQLGDILTDIGLEVEGMEEVESVKGGLKGVLCGHVLTCEKHPNADRLSLTTVNIGEESPLQIVCGAPNVAAGQKVWVATVGTTIYLPDESSFEIKKAKVRGEFSEGMICAEDELGLGSDHDGIMVLPEETQIGILASDFYKVETDFVYEIGLTPNRSDAICHLGIADDLLAYFKVNNHSDSQKVNRPDVTGFSVQNNSDQIEVEVENYEACPRYTGVVISNIEIKDSPDWMKKRLASIGVKCINNIVDITNFVLHEYGQPLHAFDLDKIGGRGIKVKTLPNGTPFITLDEQERKLSESDLMICDAASQPMCIGGVYGGLGSGVSQTTKSIFLESAHFDSTWIRRTSTKHLLRTDAAKVFEKGSDPNITVTALQRAATLMQEYAGATITSEIVDLYPRIILPKIVSIRFDHVNRLIGIPISKEQIENITAALNMEIVDSSEEGMSLAIPTNKPDVLREADVIEEILRIYGFNNIPMGNKLTTTFNVGEHPSIDEFRNEMGNLLAGLGFLEMMGLSLVNSKHYEKTLAIVGQESAEPVPVLNTSNMNMDILRPDMIITVLETVQYNQNRQQSNVKLFEFGRSYLKYGDDFSEKDHLTITLAGNRSHDNWHRKEGQTTFFTLKKVVQHLFSKAGIGKYQENGIDEDAHFQFGLEYKLEGKPVVKFGKIKPQLTSAFDIRNEIWVADFDLMGLFQAAKKYSLAVSPLSKFPSVTRDIAIVLQKSFSFSEVKRVAMKAAPNQVTNMSLFDIYQDDEQLGADNHSLAIRFEFQDNTKTLTDKDLDRFMKKIVGALKHHLNASQR